MDANDFVAKLKANGTEKDWCDLEKAITYFKVILERLPQKDRGCFCLNVLCILSRNLDKVPSWRAVIDNKALLTLTIDCVRETRGSERPERVKTLACIYHIYKYIVKQKSSLQPELILKLSYMPFEYDEKCLLKEYCKTYWNLVIDRITYIEQLKLGKLAIIKLLPKLTEDVLKVIQMYDTYQFCSSILVFLIKKLHYMYSESYPVDLNKVFGQIFDALLSKTDIKQKLSEKDSLDLFVKLNDCLYVITENSSKIHFKDSVLNNAVRTCISLIGHLPDIFHCFQTFYSNAFCNLFQNVSNLSYTESVFNSLFVSCDTTEKLGYIKPVYAMYPFINQLLRLYIEYTITNRSKKWKDIFTDETQLYCLKLILLLMRKSRKTEQFLKCDNCNVKSGLHDAMRLSFLAKHFVIISINSNIDIKTLLPIYTTLIEEQHKLLTELCTMGCTNYDKCFRKLQTDIHNTAITLNKALYYDHSIILFNIYLRNEIRCFKDTTDLKNISRALYNKSICELDCKKFEDALKNAFLSLVFAQTDGLMSDKYMSLVMDIKAKALKADDEGTQDDLQMISVMEASRICVEESLYGNIKPFFCHLKFSALLKHEFDMYAKLWPSIVPIAGVWTSLANLLDRKHVSWFTVESEDTVLSTLYEIVLETPTVVRTIHNENYVNIVNMLLDRFDITQELKPKMKIIQASLLMLKAEYRLHETALKHGWKVTEPTMDPDLAQASRTLPQEYEATLPAMRAVDILTEVLPQLKTVPADKYLRNTLQIAQVFVVQLLHLHRCAHALQLAHICCHLAEYVGDRSSYIRIAGTLLYNADRRSQELTLVMNEAGQHWRELVNNKETMETALVFVCDAAIFYAKCGAIGTSAKLLQLAQANILKAYEMYDGVNLDLAVGRLMEAQIELCRECGPNMLSAVNGAQRHYLSITNTTTKWCHRRLIALTLKHHITRTSLSSVKLCRYLQLHRRGRSACAVALPQAAAVSQAMLFAAITCPHKMDDAQVKIDNRLKHILGLQPSNDTHPHYDASSPIKAIPFTPKQDVETMLESANFKKTQISPSLPCISVPAFKTPEFLKHFKCDCYACNTPHSQIIACATSGLEASMYFRAKEIDISKNYFSGALKCFDLAEANLKRFIEKCRGKYEGYIIDIVGKGLIEELKAVEIEVLIEAAFFELSQANYIKADEFIIRIHEIIQEVNKIDVYLKNEVMNLMITSAQMRKVIKIHSETGLEAEFESLKLTPGKEPPKTPETKPIKPPELPKMIVKDEEVPKLNRKVIKLNLDDNVTEDNEVTKKNTKKSQFKIPVPITTKHVLENITPRPTRSKPNILVTQPSDEVKDTPVTDKMGFFTPVASTPDQFFTPMTSLKTYSKKSLRQNIVKNLEAEFSTPRKEDKGNMEAPKSGRPSRSKVDTKKSLKRATSPGKLDKDKPVRSSRLKQPINLRVDETK